MKLADNPFTHAIARGDKQIGLWINLCSGFAAEVTAPAGYDWALLDMEHSPADYFTLLGQLQAYAASNTTAIVRPQWNDPVIIKRLMDLGVPGLLFPMIQTVEEAQAAVAATRYPPRGIRGVSGLNRGNKFGRVPDYLARVEDETTVILQLETAAALNRADDIAMVDGVSGVFFGPADIGADIGSLGNPMAADVWDLILPVAEKLIAKGIKVGTLVSDPEFAAKLLNDGFTFVACGSDTGLLAKGSDALLADVKGRIE